MKLRSQGVVAVFAVMALGMALSGCATNGDTKGSTKGDSVGKDLVDESADFAPVSYRSVCLLENSAVQSPRLVEAIEAGLQAGGAQVKRINTGTSPTECPFVLTYDIPSTSGDGAITIIRFQTFEHGVPRVDATGRAPQGRSLTVQAVEAYAKEFLGKLEETAEERNAATSATTHAAEY